MQTMKNAKYFKDNLFFKLQTMIEGLDEIISQSKKKEDEKKVINISEFDKTYEAVYLELKTIVENFCPIVLLTLNMLGSIFSIPERIAPLPTAKKRIIYAKNNTIKLPVK